MSDPFQRTLTVAATGSLPDDVPLDLDVSVRQGTITRDDPGRIGIAATNRGDATRDVGRPYYKGASGEDGAPGILVIATDAPEGRRRRTACVGDGKTEDSLAWTEEYPVPASVPPGETVTHELLVVDDPTVVGCLPSNGYRLANSFVVGGASARVDWWFELEVA